MANLGRFSSTFYLTLVKIIEQLEEISSQRNLTRNLWMDSLDAILEFLPSFILKIIETNQSPSESFLVIPLGSTNFYVF